MKKETTYITTMTVVGLIAGLLLIYILAAIAVPAYDNFILTIEEYESFRSMDKIFLYRSDYITIIALFVTIALAITALIFTIRILNPNIKLANLNKPKNVLKLLTAVIIAFVAIPYVMAMAKELLKLPGEWAFLTFNLDRPGGMTLSGFVYGLVSNGLVVGLAWLILGEMGWLGDMSSWRIDIKAKRSGLIRSFILGAIVGILQALIGYYSEWSFMKYFIVVNEVLDGTAETSFSGFMFLGVGLMALFGSFFLIVSGLVVALSPAKLSGQYRKEKVLIPVIAIVFVVITTLAYYSYASAKYDLNKESLSEAVGLPEKADEFKTILLLRKDLEGKDIGIFRWPLEVEGWAMLTSGTVAVSETNLNRLISYIDEHPDGSVYEYTAKHALYNGYYALWDIERGLQWQHKLSEEILLARIILINKLQILPITDKNLEYLRSFIDENKWYLGNKYLVRLAKAFVHFGEIDEARRLIGIARDAGIEEEELEGIIPDGPVLKQGIITGRILINGRSPEDLKVGLFSDLNVDLLLSYIGVGSEHLQSSFLNDINIRMVDVRDLSGNGSFTFNRLGEGDYTTVLMAGDGTISAGADPSMIKISGLPDKILLSLNKRSVDIGTVNIEFK
ncbi:MAG: hypothetical protein JSV21_04920 [Nitrospirota bacterium]|nr:MAG: hypothetical protein JSV21_04920 [Nitrospirota bacterium]